MGNLWKKNTELIGDIAAVEFIPKLYGIKMYTHSEIIAHTKFGLVISIKGALRTHATRLVFGISVIPGGRSLFTYNGGSPKYFPFTIPNIFSIL